MSKTDRGRFSAKCKREAILRLFRGEELDLLSRELGVTGSTLSGWREAFGKGGLGALRSRQQMGEMSASRIWSASRTVPRLCLGLSPTFGPGQITMDNEPREKKIEKMETRVPLGRRRSKR